MEGDRGGGGLTGCKALRALALHVVDVIAYGSLLFIWPPLLTETRISCWSESDSPSLFPEPHSHAGSRSDLSDELFGRRGQCAQLSPFWVPAGLLDLPSEGSYSVHSLPWPGSWLVEKRLADEPIPSG